MKTQHVSSIDVPSLHNAMHGMVQAYGQLLAEQERRISMLSAQLKATQDELLRRAPPPVQSNGEEKPF